MSTRERPIDRGRRLAARDRVRIGAEIRTARLIAGRSLEDVAAGAGMSMSQASRIERGVHPRVTHEQLVCLGAAVRLDVRVQVYPGSDPLIDAGQVALLHRLGARLHPQLTLRLEVPLPIPGDQRAWDGVIAGLEGGSTPNLPAEAETRLVDVQAQLRRIRLKCRDAGLDEVLVVVADTRRNREALAAAASILAADYPIAGRRALRALHEGRHPGGSAIVVL